MQPGSLILLVLLAGLLFLMVNRTRRQQRTAQNLQANLTVGSRIMTTAGLYATVVELDAGMVTLETAPGQRSRWDRRAIAKVLADEPLAGAGSGADDPFEDAEDGDGPGEGIEHETDAAPPDRT